MSGYKLRPAAERDLRDIWHYTVGNWSHDQADIYINEIFDSLELLAENPQSGQMVDWIRSGYRRKVVGSHLLFYVIAQDDALEVVRILHSRLNVSEYLGGPA